MGLKGFAVYANFAHRHQSLVPKQSLRIKNFISELVRGAGALEKDTFKSSET